MYVYAKRNITGKLKEGEYVKVLKVEKRNNFKILKLDKKVLGLPVNIKFDDSVIFFPDINEPTIINNIQELNNYGSEINGDKYYIELKMGGIHLDLNINNLDFGFYNIIDTNNPKELIENILKCFGFNLKIKGDE